eukprot:CAMPEP_0175655416 /NCGR_PEP_ID=MMETSP0097-20121207/11887_1 /TAXON_ID=311494 /ORGANISM="Alexandrium monilatum, Strain CCMP3105" /LENGTH=146 /DNA_ID=CAMNT_0016961467 /DNA_START=73 /DNA_END=511 /DNA_ORIENTATION=+
MSSAVGDQTELRQRKAAAESHLRSEASLDSLDSIEQEYVEYFRNKYGENPRTDFLGIDGMALFCVIYIVIAGVVLSVLYFSVYARSRNLFGPAPDGKEAAEAAAGRCPAQAPHARAARAVRGVLPREREPQDPRGLKVAVYMSLCA